MKLAAILVILSTLAAQAQEVHSFNVMAEYSDGLPKAGVSAIMEGRIMSFRGMVLVGDDVYAQVKMGATIGRMENSRIILFPFYLNAKNYRYNTPVGVMWSRNIVKSTLEIGADFWREKTEGKTQNGFSVNVSLSYPIIGARYKNS